MSHSTTSWKSHTSTWRWTAGKDGRSPEGGKARRGGGCPALARQKAVGQHGQREVPMQPVPPPAVAGAHAALAVCVCVAGRGGPAAVGQFPQPLPWSVRRQVADVPLQV